MSRQRLAQGRQLASALGDLAQVPNANATANAGEPRMTSAKDIWQPSASLEDALAFANDQPDQNARQWVLTLVALRFLPSLDSSQQGIFPFFGLDRELILRSSLQDDKKTGGKAMNWLAELLREPSTSADVRQTILGCLCSLATSPYGAAAMVTAEVLQTLVHIIRSRRHSEPVVQSALAVLSNMALHRSVGTQLVDQDAHQVLLAILDDGSLSGRAAECCATGMANLANTRRDVVCQKLLDARAVEICTGLLAPLVDIVVLQHALLCLANLALFSASHELIRSSDAPRKAISTVWQLLPMERDSSRPLGGSVQLMAAADSAMAMCARIVQNGERGINLDKEDIGRAVDILAAFPGKSTLQTYGCVLLLSYVAELDLNSTSVSAHLSIDPDKFTAALAAACVRGDDHVVNAYLKFLDLDVNEPRSFPLFSERVPLIEFALSHGRVSVVRALLENGAKRPEKDRLTVLIKKTIETEDMDLRFRRLLCLALIHDDSAQAKQEHKSEQKSERQVCTSRPRPQTIADCNCNRLQRSGWRKHFGCPLLHRPFTKPLPLREKHRFVKSKDDDDEALCDDLLRTSLIVVALSLLCGAIAALVTLAYLT